MPRNVNKTSLKRHRLPVAADDHREPQAGRGRGLGRCAGKSLEVAAPHSSLITERTEQQSRNQ